MTLVSQSLLLVYICVILRVDITACTSQGFSDLQTSFSSPRKHKHYQRFSTNSRYIDDSEPLFKSNSSLHIPRSPQSKAKTSLRSSRIVSRQLDHQSSKLREAQRELERSKLMAQQFEKLNIPTDKYTQYSQKSITKTEKDIKEQQSKLQLSTATLSRSSSPKKTIKSSTTSKAESSLFQIPKPPPRHKHSVKTEKGLQQQRNNLHCHTAQMSKEKKESGAKPAHLDEDEQIVSKQFQLAKPSMCDADKTHNRSNTNKLDSSFRQTARQQAFEPQLQLQRQRRQVVTFNLAGISQNNEKTDGTLAQTSVSSTNDHEESNLQLNGITVSKLLSPYGLSGKRVAIDIYDKIQSTQKELHPIEKRKYEIKLIILENIKAEIVNYHQKVSQKTQQQGEMIANYFEIADNIDRFVSYDNIFPQSKSKYATIEIQFANYYLFFEAYKKMKLVEYADFGIFKTLYLNILNTETQHVLDICKNLKNIETLAQNFVSAMKALDNLLSQLMLYQYRSQSVHRLKLTLTFIEVLQQWWKRQLRISKLPISSNWSDLRIEKQVLQAIEDVNVKTLNTLTEKSHYATTLIENIDFFIDAYEFRNINVFNLYIDFKLLGGWSFTLERWRKCVAFRNTDAAVHEPPNDLDGQILMQQFNLHEIFDEAEKRIQRYYSFYPHNVDTGEYENTVAALQDILKVCDIEFKHFNREKSSMLCDIFSHMNYETLLRFVRNTGFIFDNLYRKTKFTAECKKSMPSILHAIAFHMMQEFELSGRKTKLKEVSDNYHSIKRAYKWLSCDTGWRIAALINRDDDTIACKIQLESTLKISAQKDFEIDQLKSKIETEYRSQK